MTIGSTCDNEHHKLKFGHGKLQVYKVYNGFVDLWYWTHTDLVIYDKGLEFIW